MKNNQILKRFFLFFLFISLSLQSLSAVEKNLNLYAENEGNMQPKALIVYLSRTQNTQVVADIIHDYVGGDVVAIELENPYPSDYSTMVEQVSKENNIGYLPLLKTKINNIEDYSVIFLGFPTWGMQMPPPIKSFLNESNLKQKVVVPFNTNAGYGVGSGFTELKQRCIGCTILDGIVIEGGKERDGIFLVIKDQVKSETEIKIQQWLQQLAKQNQSIARILQSRNQK